VYRTSSSHEEGCDREFAIMTKALLPDATGARVAKLAAVHVEVAGGKLREVPGSELEIPADLVLLAMGFTGPERGGLVADLGLALDARGNVVADARGATSVPKVFAAGDASRGQSLVVWAIADGRRAAAGVDAYLRSRAAAA
jgi:glutamate synthase (NADPH/NADH) small chain